MSDPTIPGGKKLCPSCTTYVGVNDSVCGNCGYNFETGENPDGGGDEAGTPGRPLTVYSESSGPPRVGGSGAGKVIAIAVALLIVGVAGGIFFFANSLIDTAEDVTTEITDIDVPGIGEFTFSPGDIGGGTNPATDYRSCVRLMNEYLKKVLANDGQPGNLAGILEDAVTEMGISSAEFSNFTTIYTANAGTAVTQGTKPALKQAKKDAKAACRREWGS